MKRLVTRIKPLQSRLRNVCPLRMRYAIFSDIHSNLEALEAVLAAYQKERIDQYLCIGDVVGYGANPNECIQKVRSIAAVTVAGNHDQASVGVFPSDDFNPEAKEAVDWTARNLTEASRIYLNSLALVHEIKELTLVHGSLDNPQEFNYLINVYNCAATFDLLQTNICFIGHTHVPVIFIEDNRGDFYFQDVESLALKAENKYIVNVGSVGQPRDSVPQAAYCIFDTATNTVEIKRAQYEVFTARRKIIEAGLPQFLGDRLLTGN